MADIYTISVLPNETQHFEAPVTSAQVASIHRHAPQGRGLGLDRGHTVRGKTPGMPAEAASSGISAAELLYEHHR